MSNKEEITIKDNVLFKGKILEFHNDDIKCPSGNLATREYVKHPGGVGLIAIVDNKLVLVSQYRYPYHKEILEIPAGKLEKGEDPMQAGLRELEEETGFKANKLISLGCIYPTVGYSDEIIYLFATDNLVKTKTHFDEDENIDTKLYSLNEVNEMIKSGLIVDSKTICGYYKYLEYIKNN